MMKPLIAGPVLWKPLLLIALFCGACQRGAFPVVPVVPGVSLALAEYRKAVLDSIAYDIQLQVPEGADAPVQASETITFRLSQNRQPLQLDFKEAAGHIGSVRVNGKPVPLAFQSEHILLHPRYLQKGHNAVAIQFTAGNLSLNRNAAFLYTLLVPDRARTVFPCFDQPDLKARFTLRLTLPAAWKAVANAPLQDSAMEGTRKTYRYRPSDRISTYLFSFVAGQFERVDKKDGRPMQFYHRETDAAKQRHSLQPIFWLHDAALRYLEWYTGIPYPFQKLDFAAIPDFQYGGMEHVGAIQYKAASLFLDSGATREEVLARAGLIAHETAHMWFGDLVTMRWFNDVWMKEVFANFMADKITQAVLPGTQDDLKFLLGHFPPAYGVDRTAGANPIRQPLANLQQAGTLYGNIIYHKAPIVMRQLESMMGEEPFRQGVQEYLLTYAHGNASWPELVRILDRRTPLDLSAWSRVWVEEAGRPLITYRLEGANGRISRLVVQQKGEDSSGRSWPQAFDLALGYGDSVALLPVTLQGREADVPAAAGRPLPGYLLFNATGKGYGLFPADTALVARPFPKDAVLRASAYINLYENMLSGRGLRPQRLIEVFLGAIAAEREELNLQYLAGQVSDAYWRLLPPARRQSLSAEVEGALWTALEKDSSANHRKILFRAYQSVATTPAARDRLYAIWKYGQPPAGVHLAEEDYTSLALALALRAHPDGRILEEQGGRIKNPDRRQRLQFLMPALSGRVEERDAFFASLQQASNREKEAWVTAAVQYLHHPLRAATAQKYLQPSLELLEALQRTGDIFFPQSWLSATLGAYQSAEAAAIVRRFLEARPGYNPALKAKILQAADPLFRAERLLAAEKTP